MNSVWQQLTLTNLPLQQWGASSYLHRLVGLLRSWRQSSWLLQWSDQIATILVLLVFAVAPFVSTGLIGLLLLACTAFWILLTVSDEVENGITPIHLLVLLYWAIATVATVLSPVKAAAMEGWVKLTLYLVLFALLARVLRSPRIRTVLVTVYLLVALVVSVAGLRQWFFGAAALATWVDTESTLAGTTRVYSYLGNPNLLASYLVPATVFSAAAVFVWKGWLPKALAVFLWVMNSACLILTFSRGGWIGFVVAQFALLMLFTHWFSVYLPRFWRRWLLPIVLAVSAAIVVVAVASVSTLRDRVASIFAGRDDSSNNFRMNVWMAVVDMIRDRPIIGIGPGNDAFNRIYPRYQQTGYTALSAYSVFLEIAVETGLIGLGCFLWLLLITFNQGWMQIQRLRQVRAVDGFWLMAAIATMSGMLLHGLVDTVWYRPQVSTLWWLMVALVASYYQPLLAESSAETEVEP
ncbi:putative bicarbonate transporter, IctB family [Oculatella sp. LEGE 06141]|uniref:IctB family putative bicarbonate transporter n=1 Tax=Oculatella sp. LEGE 06141 TaxID=1828648 RepID=UPI0018801B34|nr:IctB family putative bicarbonate transporter [Oculatella sp. LEGE 06141]MBE9181847.1 putative bicarbonate transporter, IctB family [Oculatella sp. LEGE 06141]